MNACAIETGQVSKIFGDGSVAVNEVDLQIAPGTVYGLVGRNGAGKTTLIRMLMGLLRPSNGYAHLLGDNMWTASRRHRARVTYVQQNQDAGVRMSLVELSYFCSHFYERWDAAYAEKLTHHFELPPTKPISALSGGQKRKAFIVGALAARPDVMLLDEPAAGLDPVSRRELINMLIEAIADHPECTILFSTHIISDLDRIADRIGIMEKSRLKLSDGVDELKSKTKRVQIIFEGDAPPQDFALPGALSFEAEGPVVKAVVNEKSFETLEKLRDAPGVRIQEFSIGLEDLVIELMENGGGEISCEN